MKFKLSICLVFLAATVLCADPDNSQTILNRMEQARKPTLGVPVKSFITKTVSFIPSTELPLYIDYAFKAPAKIRIVTRISGAPSVVQVYNGRIAWERRGNAPPQLLEGAAADYLRFFALLSNPQASLSDCFEKIHVDASPVTIDKVPCHKVTGTPAGHFRQFPVVYYVAHSDFLPRRIDMGIFADGSLSLMTSWFGTYRNYGGLILPEETRTASPHTPVVSRILGVTVNPEISDGEFDMPLR